MPPDKIAVTTELQRMPALLAKFIFQRTVPDGDAKAPSIFAKKHCVGVVAK